MAGAESQHDPLVNLRAYRQLAPWNLRDLAALTAAILDAAAVRPINAAAAAHPSERTIRFYVARHLVAAPVITSYSIHYTKLYDPAVEASDGPSSDVTAALKNSGLGLPHTEACTPVAYSSAAV